MNIPKLKQWFVEILILLITLTPNSNSRKGFSAYFLT